MTNFEKVVEFHKAFKVEGSSKLRTPSPEEEDLCIRLIREEFKELEKAYSLKDIAKELTDLLYVTYRMAYIYGINADAVFDLVHQSNMSKLGADGQPIYREDGKVLKGPNYFEPDLTEVL